MSNDALAVEHEVQRQMLKRLSIEWTPGEPFYALIADEIERLRSELKACEEDRDGLHHSLDIALGLPKDG